MIGINRHRNLIPVFAGEALVNLGIVGVAWGTALPRLFVSLLVGPVDVRRYLGVQVRTYYMQVLLRPALGMVPFAVATQVIETWWPPANVFGFFGQVRAALPVAALGAWFVVLTSRERRALAGAVALPGLAKDEVSE